MMKFINQLLKERATKLVIAATVFTICNSAWPQTPITVPPAIPNSVYQLPITLTDQDGQTFAFSARRGKAQLISMFYTSCKFTCPLLINTLKNIDNQLTPNQRDQLGILLVTFDPTHDSVDVLRRTAEEHSIHTDRWSLARTDEQSVRKLAALLGTQYRALPNGDFNHTTSIVLLDSEGRIITRSAKTGTPETSFIDFIKKTIESSKQ